MEDIKEYSELVNCFDYLPSELVTFIFAQLNVKNVFMCSKVCTEWNELIVNDQSLWKRLCYRDHMEYLTTIPYMDEKPQDIEPGLLSRLRENPIFEQLITKYNDENQIEEEMESDQKESNDEPFEETNFAHSPNYAATEHADDDDLTEEEEQSIMRVFNTLCKRKREPTKESVAPDFLKPKNWKNFYKECYQKIDFNGVWIGKYGGHGDELVKVTHKGFLLEGEKITGDLNVPAGKPTFKMTLNRNIQSGLGEIHLADTGYVNPRWGKATVTIIDKDHFTLSWSHLYWTFPLPFERQIVDEKHSSNDEMMVTDNKICSV